MKSDQPIDKLNQAILAIKQQNSKDYNELKTGLKVLNERITPSNIIKDVVEKWTLPFMKNSTEFKTIFAPFLGIVAQKVVAGKSSNPLKALLGFGAELIVNQIVNKYINKNTP